MILTASYVWEYCDANYDVTRNQHIPGTAKQQWANMPARGRNLKVAAQILDKIEPLNCRTLCFVVQRPGETSSTYSTWNLLLQHLTGKQRCLNELSKHWSVNMKMPES